MASTTTNLGLTKPAYTDDADVAVINANSDILDAAYGSLSDQMGKFTKVLWEGSAFTSGSLTVPNLDDYRVVELFFSDTSSMIAIRAGSSTILWGSLTFGAYGSNGISTIACRYGVPGGNVIQIDASNRGYTDGTTSNYSGNTIGLVRVIGISPYPAA